VKFFEPNIHRARTLDAAPRHISVIREQKKYSKRKEHRDRASAPQTLIVIYIYKYFFINYKSRGNVCVLVYHIICKSSHSWECVCVRLYVWQFFIVAAERKQFSVCVLRAERALSASHRIIIIAIVIKFDQQTSKISSPWWENYLLGTIEFCLHKHKTKVPWAACWEF